FWWLIALWTDVVGTFAHLRWLNASWAPDTNYPFLLQSLQMYYAPNWLTRGLFLGILLWSAVSTVAFFIASLSLRKESAIWMRKAEIAFIISISFWLAFFLADQIVMKYDLEQNHMVQGGFQLLSYLALTILK